jgi:hypothetical protein
VVSGADPKMKYFHSSLLIRPYISRIAPGSIVNKAAEILVEIGKLRESMILTEPPGTVYGCWRERWKL